MEKKQTAVEWLAEQLVPKAMLTYDAITYNAIQQAKQGHFQAAKWVADRGWATRGAGRPSKAEIEREKTIQTRINDEYDGDVVRMFANQNK